MRKVVILFFCSLWALTDLCRAQEIAPVADKPIIESVDVSGVPDNRITVDIRQAMQALVGQQFDQLAADELGFQIQKQVAQRISAIRQLPGSVPDRVKLLFEFSSEASPEPERESSHGIHIEWDTNVNSRYSVESVDIRGFSESQISDSLREDIHKLVGEKLDEERANDIEHRLRRELRPRHKVSRRVERGSDREHIRLVFEAEDAPLFEFHKFGDYIVGQSKQGVSYGLGIDIDHHNNRVAVGVLDDGDALIERDEGYHLGFENIHTGTEHLGFRIEYFDYDQKWKLETQLASNSSPEIPGLYRQRRGIEPGLTVAVDRRFRFDVGVNLAELQMQYPQLHFQNANALTATATYEDRWEETGIHQKLSLDYTIRSATHNLNSDFIYTRHLAEIHYNAGSGRSQFIGSAMAGLISGAAPLFERFDLGNTSTLRGWNKYDLAPLGGDRMGYGSFEYRYSVMQVFYDVGSVWQHSTPYQVSHAFGVGLHSRLKDDDTWFVTFGVPIRSGHVQPLKPLFMIGGRF